MEDNSPRNKTPTDTLTVEIPVVDNSEDIHEEEETVQEHDEHGTEKQGENNTETPVQLNVGAETDAQENADVEITYDPTGTHIVEHNVNQNQMDTLLDDSEVKENEEDIHTVVPKFTENIAIKDEGENDNNSDIVRHSGRPSDIVRPMKHQRRTQKVLTTEEEDLGIYEDTAEGDDLTDTELEVLKSKYKSARLKKEQEKVIEETETKKEDKLEKPPVQDAFVPLLTAEHIKRTFTKIKSAPKQIQDDDVKEFSERLGQRGKTAVSCITDVFQESRLVNSSFLHNHHIHSSLLLTKSEPCVVIRT